LLILYLKYYTTLCTTLGKIFQGGGGIKCWIADNGFSAFLRPYWKFAKATWLSRECYCCIYIGIFIVVFTHLSHINQLHVIRPFKNNPMLCFPLVTIVVSNTAHYQALKALSGRL